MTSHSTVETATVRFVSFWFTLAQSSIHDLYKLVPSIRALEFYCSFFSSFFTIRYLYKLVPRASEPLEFYCSFFITPASPTPWHSTTFTLQLLLVFSSSWCLSLVAKATLNISTWSFNCNWNKRNPSISFSICSCIFCRDDLADDLICCTWFLIISRLSRCCELLLAVDCNKVLLLVLWWWWWCILPRRWRIRFHRWIWYHKLKRDNSIKHTIKMAMYIIWFCISSWVYLFWTSICFVLKCRIIILWGSLLSTICSYSIPVGSTWC